MAFASIDDAIIGRLEESGLLFYRMGPGTIRLVTSWQTTEAEIVDTLRRFERALS